MGPDDMYLYADGRRIKWDRDKYGWRWSTPLPGTDAAQRWQNYQSAAASVVLDTVDETEDDGA
jgi:hypothetical protein